jgi:hypothetical protein
VAATLIIDVLILSSLCLAWAHSHGPKDAQGDDPQEAWHAAQASLKGALRNPLLWSMALGMAFAWWRWHLPKPVDETVRLLGLSATPAALFTLGAILARAQMQRATRLPAGKARQKGCVGASVAEAGAASHSGVWGRMGAFGHRRALGCIGLADGDVGSGLAFGKQCVDVGPSVKARTRRWWRGSSCGRRRAPC